MNVKVSDLMQPNVLTLQKHHSMDHARSLMEKHNLHALPVITNDGEVSGIVSSTDLLNKDLSDSTPVSHFMTRRVYTIPQYNDIHFAARLLRNHRIHHVVVTHEKKIVGILSSFDLLKLVEDHRFIMKQAPTPKGGSKDEKSETLKD